MSNIEDRLKQIDANLDLAAHRIGELLIENHQLENKIKGGKTTFVIQGQWADPNRPGWFDCGSLKTLEEAKHQLANIIAYRKEHPRPEQSVMSANRFVKRIIIDEVVG